MKTIIKAAAKKSLNNVARKTVAEACAPKKRGRPSNAELAERAAKEAKAAERLKAKEAKAKAKIKEEKKAPKKEVKAPKAAPKKEDKKAAATSNFKLAAFKRAISSAFAKKDKDTSRAVEVMAMYKEHRKMLKDVLPKHAVNAFEKSLAAKKDEKLLVKAIESAQKHIVEKDFTM